MALAGGAIEKSHYTCHEPRVIVIATGLAAIMYSVRRVGEYSSSFLDLKDCTQHKGMECTPRDRTSQRSDKPPRTTNAKEHATNRLIQIQKELQRIRVRSPEARRQSRNLKGGRGSIREPEKSKILKY